MTDPAHPAAPATEWDGVIRFSGRHKPWTPPAQSLPPFDQATAWTARAIETYDESRWSESAAACRIAEALWARVTAEANVQRAALLNAPAETT